MQIDVAEQSGRLVAQTDPAVGGLQTPCFTADSAHLLLPWQSLIPQSHFCLDILSTSCNAEGRKGRVRVSDAAFRRAENFAGTGDGVAVTQPQGLLVYDLQGAQVQDLQWGSTARHHRAPDLLASAPHLHSLAVLQLEGGACLRVYDSGTWQLQSCLPFIVPEGSYSQYSGVARFVLASSAGVMLSSADCTSQPLSTRTLLLSQQGTCSLQQTWLDSYCTPVLSSTGRRLACAMEDSCVHVLSTASGIVQYEARITPAARVGVTHLALAWTPWLGLLGCGFDSHAMEATEDPVLLIDF